MDIIEVAIHNAALDARLKAKAMQTRAKSCDKTRRQRAIAANLRDQIDKPSSYKSATDKRVHFAVPLVTPEKGQGSWTAQPAQSLSGKKAWAKMPGLCRK